MEGSVDELKAKIGVVRREAAFIFIFATVLLDMLAIGVVIPVLPKLVVDFVGGDTQEAAKILGVFGTAWALMQFLFSPLQGALSDSFGRRTMILISNFGVGLDYVLMALAPTLRVAVCRPRYLRHHRGEHFDRLCLCGRRHCAGQARGALRSPWRRLRRRVCARTGARRTCRRYFTAVAILDRRGLSLANALYGFLVLPESLPRSLRTGFRWKNANPLGALTLLRSHAELFGLAVVYFLDNLAHVVLPSISVLYMFYRYGWDERIVGLTLAGVGVASIIVQGAIAGPVTKHVGERAALMIGLGFGVAGFLVAAFAQTGAVFWIGIPLLALWGLESPAAMSLMSRRVGPSEQGQLQGANSSVAGIANLLGPALFTQVFAFAIGTGRAWQQPGAPFLIAALLIAAAGVLAWRVTRT